MHSCRVTAANPQLSTPALTPTSWQRLRGQRLLGSRGRGRGQGPHPPTRPDCTGEGHRGIFEIEYADSSADRLSASAAPNTAAARAPRLRQGSRYVGVSMAHRAALVSLPHATRPPAAAGEVREDRGPEAFLKGRAAAPMVWALRPTGLYRGQQMQRVKRHMTNCSRHRDRIWVWGAIARASENVPLIIALEIIISIQATISRHVQTQYAISLSESAGAFRGLRERRAPQ